MTPIDYTGKILEGPSPCACPFCGKPGGNLRIIRTQWRVAAYCSLCHFGVCGGDEPLSVMGIFKTLDDKQHAAHLMKGALEEMLRRFESELQADDEDGKTLPYPEVDLSRQALRAAREAGIE